MARSRFEFYDNVWNDDLNHMQKGFQTNNLTNIFTGDGDILYTIPMKYEYRPDLIAKYFYGEAKLYWVIVFANNFQNCPEDFTVNRIIRIPKYERVLDLT
jgi:hypothetical protein